MVSAPASLITLSLLAGCSSPANSEAQSSLTKVNVVVTQAQIERIVREIAGTVFDADKTLDQNLLASRVSGPAFDARKVQYFLVGKSKKIARPEAITANPITLSLPMQLPEQSLGWQPRILMVITKSSNTTKAPQMLVLQQATPRENYKLWYLVNLLPTENFPDVPAVDTGTLATGVSDSFLSVKLTSLPYMYGDVLNKGAESKFYEQFDLTSDQFYASVSQSQQADLAKLKKANSVKFVHSLGNSNVFGLLSKADEQGNGGGGLVAMAINDTSVIKPKVRGAAAAVTTVDKKLLLGADGSSTGLNIVYQNMMLFYIPVAGKAEKIRLLGASSSILSVKALN
jgi:hypothetical protein